MDRKAKADMLKGREARALPGGLITGGFEFREEGNELRVAGYASVTEQKYDMGWYQESVTRGAFAKTLSENPDVQLLVNHEGLPLARTKNGSLTLSEDSTGLRFEASLDVDDPTSALIRSKITQGLMDQCSFAFRVTRQTWDSDYENRSIDEVSLDRGDVSICNYGASPTTSVQSVRSFFADLADLDDEKLAELREDPTVITVLRKLAVPTPDEIIVIDGQMSDAQDAELRAEYAKTNDLALFRARAQALKFRQK